MTKRNDDHERARNTDDNSTFESSIDVEEVVEVSDETSQKYKQVTRTKQSMIHQEDADHCQKQEPGTRNKLEQRTRNERAARRERDISQEQGTTHCVLRIAEETRTVFDDDDVADATASVKYCSPVANDNESESSLDCEGDSSTSNDQDNHTVKADLYGTDRDPSYHDDSLNVDSQSSYSSAGDHSQNQRIPRHSPRVTTARESAASGTLYPHASPRPPVYPGLHVPGCGAGQASPHVVVEADQNNNTVPSPHLQLTHEANTAGLFLEGGCEAGGVPARSSQIPTVVDGEKEACSSDIEVYRRSYLVSHYPAGAAANTPATAAADRRPCQQHQQLDNVPRKPDCYQEPREPGQSPSVAQQQFYPASNQQNQQQFNSTAASNAPTAFTELPTKQEFSGMNATDGSTATGFNSGSPATGVPGAATTAMQQFQKAVAVKAQVYNELSERQYLSPTSYRRGFTDEQNIAAEQLASELVKTYGGQNSHMISEILKASAGHEEGCAFPYGGFERQPEMDTSSQHYSTPQMINDVLNTPQQLATLGAGEYPDKFAGDQSRSTSDAYSSSKVEKVSPDMHGSVTYNHTHAHAHGGDKWSSHKYGVYPAAMHENSSENPFPAAASRRNTVIITPEEYTDQSEHPPPHPQQQHEQQRNPHHLAAPGSQSNLHPEFGYDCRQQRATGQEAGPQQQGARNFGGVSPPNGLPNGTQRDPAEITKTTFTSREHMEMHLSDKHKYKLGKDSLPGAMSDVDYSSIYPSRDFIERTACNSGSERKAAAALGSMKLDTKPIDGSYEQRMAMKEQHEEAVKRYSQFQEHRPPKKRRISKYNTDELRVPPQMPLFDDTIQKYATVCNRDEIHSSRHKYFVVNPSEVTHMAPKALVTKYIDFLIGENEQITEISKSVNPPVDIYVTEDMYFMDSLKFQVPFPSKKFVEWVGSFYPRLHFFDMKFKGQHPCLPTREALMRADTRPTQQILEDTFYYFQREVMNVVKP